MTTETTPPASPKPEPGNRKERRAAAAAAKKANEKPEIQPRRTWVVFVHDDAEGFERHDRAWVDVPDIRTTEQALSIEQVLAETRKLTNVRIINWKALEG
ncbi:hypothetical protein [Methylorubrum extorquens]|uniref:hypothetical protein n=1 Tax=Methylorubrum extorquens TaxID=408 RepID=UPI00209F7FD5|nr:hypothetical protein [Methylorubrum extorquens]MCP1540014.1 hypothetical protein [Methylorubrum extorquens]